MKKRDRNGPVFSYIIILNMKIKLSDRLFRVAGYVEQGAVPVDVGTDHAYVPIYLLQNGVSPRAYATDNRPGPLENAGFDAKKYGVEERLTLYLCDGLALCDKECLDTVIIAGMGGETMIRILQKTPWALEKRLILQPQSKLPELRRYLAANGLSISDAVLAEDAGKLYQIWLAGEGAMDAEALIEPCLIEKRDPLLKPYLAEQIDRRKKQIHGLEASRQPDGDALRRLDQELDTLECLFHDAP